MSELIDRSGVPICIGISSCLLGQQVRFDGGHKHNGYVTQTLGQYFQFVPFCPEMAIGLGVPRTPIRLLQCGDRVRAVSVRDRDVDVTDALSAYADKVADETPSISAYIFKKGSPSCGMERVKIYAESGVPVSSGNGVYAQTLMRRLPLLPVEEEGRLTDPVLRENFIERIFIYHRWQVLVAGGLTSAKLIDFHTEHKFSVLAHDEARYRDLGRLVAGVGGSDIDVLAQNYVETLMVALRRCATRKRHTNVLMHVMGYLKDFLDAGDKAELVEVIGQYRLGHVPLIVPITLLRHHLRRHPNEYIERQHYMRPHPDEQMLRNSL